jgi:hypothetical protein
MFVEMLRRGRGVGLEEDACPSYKRLGVVDFQLLSQPEKRLCIR